MGIEVSQNGVVVYGSFLTYRVAWRDVAGFASHRVSFSQIVDLKLADGRTIKTSLVQGVSVTWQEGKTRDILSVLQSELSSRGVARGS
jgi:hypothetical protein